MDDELDLEFTPASGPGLVKFDPVSTPEGFRSKATKLLSDAMDFLAAKVEGEMAEASDIKTIVEIGKMFKVGIPTVQEAAEKALAEAAEYEDIEDDDYGVESMRFEE